jgi:hypothetical protein
MNALADQIRKYFGMNNAKCDLLNYEPAVNIKSMFSKNLIAHLAHSLLNALFPQSIPKLFPTIYQPFDSMVHLHW